MVKAADSPWKLNDRSNNWLKIKPEYVEVRPFFSQIPLAVGWQA